MKKLLITSIAVVVISIVFTMGFLVMKLNNYNLFEIELPKKVFHFDKKEKKHKPKEVKKEENKANVEKVVVKEKSNNEIEHINGKVPDFKGHKQTEVYEFAQEHGLKYELGPAVITSDYNLKGTVAKQSVEPGKSMTKNETLKISIYIFDTNYDSNN
ncbi:PASTA domain-containing protein [Paraclostridium sordellii]|uniref:PASTA domain n=1 Tax=Paraclostridium sordellii TaxID=1505 RepID=A0A0C7R574_PARSO|nr:PASTA domain-containing protein [Paeniclostridium sordellii]CEN22089.1 PASTA domain [[Clostridium] sordellii] [Paeniclostridium sordellii]CEN78919.1 PASTA domain [[Clostridium] sordellii] [Paeniclostridium sordellii]CEP40075.1 PASTA domain [[Clostridium] sordellii] [Paeniclostridium sordellii]CEP96073.1 PASTA domain [[Clostridium] sordellii] [Paeniclostridium sordellii]CEQ01899.1 PASTA domain [[Clostridium] sordellii] [Paeniclostridium sordellii]